MGFSNYSYTISQAFSQGSVSFNGFTGFVDGITKIFTVIFQLISGVMDALNALISGLTEINDILSDMISALSNHSTDGYPILEAVGAYRYLVGDFVFYMTYLVIGVSLMLTIWHLVYLVYRRINMMYNKTTIGNRLFEFTDMLP